MRTTTFFIVLSASFMMGVIWGCFQKVQAGEMSASRAVIEICITALFWLLAYSAGATRKEDRKKKMKVKANYKAEDTTYNGEPYLMIFERQYYNGEPTGKWKWIKNVKL
jgi:hypothetical protein